VSAEQVRFYVDLLDKVRATPEWKELMAQGAFNQTALEGAEFRTWLEREEERHRQLMAEAGFLAK
jgi:tripartite-type tricarboxylate transporter receptor subunit TctC